MNNYKLIFLIRNFINDSVVTIGWSLNDTDPMFYHSFILYRPGQST